MVCMIKPISIGIIWPVLLFGTAAAVAQTRFTPISNLNQPSTQAENPVWNAQSLAASFRTGNTAAFLAGVSVSLANAKGSGGHFHLALYSDVGGSPGGSLADLSGNPTPTSAGIYTYTNTATLALAAETAYWIVASSPDATGPTAFEWNFTDSSGLDAGSSWTTATSKGLPGSAWITAAVYQQFSVMVTNPTPPAIAIFQPVMLTFPVSGFPFVLQQNGDLATTNWVAATNAIQMATVSSNQTVFLAPPAGQQMFYRLSLP